MSKSPIFNSLEEACKFAHVTVPNKLIYDGCYHSADIIGDPKGKDDARILLFKDKSGGIVWNWKADEDKQKVLFFGDEYHVDKPQLNQAYTSQISAKNVKAQKICFSLWERAVFAKNDHPYLVKKQITAQGDLKELPIDELAEIIGYVPNSSGIHLKGRILIAFRANVEHQLCTVDFIDECGLKSSLYGGLSKGAFWKAQDLPNNQSVNFDLGLAEGVATALSVKKHFDIDVIAVAGCGNFIQVAASLKDKYPNISLHIFSDVGNGMEMALSAATQTNSNFYIPKFTKDMVKSFKHKYGKKPTDFNDYYLIGE